MQLRYRIEALALLAAGSWRDSHAPIVLSVWNVLSQRSSWADHTLCIGLYYDEVSKGQRGALPGALPALTARGTVLQLQFGCQTARLLAGACDDAEAEF